MAISKTGLDIADCAGRDPISISSALRDRIGRVEPGLCPNARSLREAVAAL